MRKADVVTSVTAVCCSLAIHYHPLKDDALTISIFYPADTYTKGNGMITVEKSDPHSPDSHYLTEKLSAELATITGDSGKSNFTSDSMNGDRSLWALARNIKGEAIGCGAIRPLTGNIAELKRMFSDRSSPGIGNALLTFLETSAKRMGIPSSGLKPGLLTTGLYSFIKKMATSALRITDHT